MRYSSSTRSRAEAGLPSADGAGYSALHPPDDVPALHWLSADPVPRLVMTGQRKVLWCNTSALAKLRPPLPLSVINNQLQLFDPRAADRLERLLGALDGERQCVPVLDANEVTRAVLNCEGGTYRGEDVALIMVGLPGGACGGAAKAMSRHYALTPAEAEVVAGICAHEPPAEIAARLGVSVHTVRTHLRHVYHKAAVHTQAQLVDLCHAFYAS